MATLRVETPKSFGKYVTLIESLQRRTGQQFWYRGCGKSTYQLLPGLYRHKTKRDNIDELAKLELQVMARFRNLSIPFHNKSLTDDWDALFFMQHHRVPTRLLDWSENPFVAFFFAVTSAATKSTVRGASFTDDAAIWILDPVKWNRHSLKHQSFDGEILITKDKELKGYQPAPSFSGMYNHPVALYGSHNSPRIVAQRGVFTVFGQSCEPMEKAFVTGSFPKDSLIKVMLKKNVLKEMRSAILAYGVTESVIYPDLDGLAKEIQRFFGFEV